MSRIPEVSLLADLIEQNIRARLPLKGAQDPALGAVAPPESRGVLPEEMPCLDHSAADGDCPA
jgi:hypothetical protein